MSFKLSVRQGPRPNLVFELDKDSYSIGREVGNDIVIEDPQVSRRHAQLSRQGNSYLIEDVGSTNGTYVNGKRVTAQLLLSNGDMIGLADTVIIAVQAPLSPGEDALVADDTAHAPLPSTLPAFTPPNIQPQPAPRAQTYTPPPQPQPVYTPRAAVVPPQSAPAPDNRRMILIGVGCLALLLVVCLVGFVAWSFIDCASFSSVFKFLFPPFQC